MTLSQFGKDMCGYLLGFVESCQFVLRDAVSFYGGGQKVFSLKDCTLNCRSLEQICATVWFRSALAVTSLVQSAEVQNVATSAE